MVLDSIFRKLINKICFEIIIRDWIKLIEISSSTSQKCKLYIVPSKKYNFRKQQFCGNHLTQFFFIQSMQRSSGYIYAPNDNNYLVMLLQWNAA